MTVLEYTYKSQFTLKFVDINFLNNSKLSSYLLIGQSKIFEIIIRIHSIQSFESLCSD